MEQSGRWRDRITIGELSPDGDPFDLVLLPDVLVTVPAYQWLWGSHDVLNHHVRRYSAGALRRELEGAGLEVLSARYLFQSLVVPKLVTRVLESFSHPPPRVPSIPPAPMNAAVQA